MPFSGGGLELPFSGGGFELPFGSGGGLELPFSSGGGGLVGALGAGGVGVVTADTSTSMGMSSTRMSSSAESGDVPGSIRGRVVPLSRSARRTRMRSP